MQLTNDEKRQIMDAVQEIVRSACKLQHNIDMAQCMSNLSANIIGIKLSDEEMSCIIETYRKHNQACVNNFIEFLGIDLKNDPYWTQAKERAEEMKKMVEKSLKEEDESTAEG